MILESAEIKPKGAFNLPHLTATFTKVDTVEDAGYLMKVVMMFFNTGRVGGLYDPNNHTLVIQCFLWKN